MNNELAPIIAGPHTLPSLSLATRWLVRPPREKQTSQPPSNLFVIASMNNRVASSRFFPIFIANAELAKTIVHARHHGGGNQYLICRGSALSGIRTRNDHPTALDSGPKSLNSFERGLANIMKPPAGRVIEFIGEFIPCFSVWNEFTPGREITSGDE